MKKLSLLYLVLALVFGGLALVVVDFAMGQYPQPIPHQQFMERKLDSTNRIMEGIARSNFDMINQHAQRLHLLSREASWNVLATPDYLRLSEDFRATTTQLKEAAEKKNLDAAGLAYVKLSISCVECHRYARKESADLKPAPNWPPSVGRPPNQVPSTP